MKPAFSMWIIGCMCLLLTQHTVVASPSIEHYPHYFDGKPGLPEQKTPKTLGGSCREAVEDYVESCLYNTLHMPIGEPFSNISSKQLSWSFLHKKDDHRAVIREIFLTTFILKNGERHDVISIADSTNEECAIKGKYYMIANDLTGDEPQYRVKENDDGSTTLFDNDEKSSTILTPSTSKK